MSVNNEHRQSTQIGSRNRAVSASPRCPSRMPSRVHAATRSGSRLSRSYPPYSRWTALNDNAKEQGAQERPIDILVSARQARPPLLWVVQRVLEDRGWMVATGLKFGVDFLLYESSVEFVHARYAVLVVDSLSLTWRDLIGVSRLCGHVAKTLLLAVGKAPQLTDREDTALEESLRRIFKEAYGRSQQEADICLGRHNRAVSPSKQKRLSRRHQNATATTSVQQDVETSRLLGCPAANTADGGGRRSSSSNKEARQTTVNTSQDRPGDTPESFEDEDHMPFDLLEVSWWRATASQQM